MVIGSLDSVKKSLKKKETEIEKKIVGLLPQATDRSKRPESKTSECWNSRLRPCTYLLVRLTLNVTSAFTFIDYFQKVNFE